MLSGCSENYEMHWQGTATVERLGTEILNILTRWLIIVKRLQTLLETAISRIVINGQPHKADLLGVWEDYEWEY